MRVSTACRLQLRPYVVRQAGEDLAHHRQTVVRHAGNQRGAVLEGDEWLSGPTGTWTSSTKLRLKYPKCMVKPPSAFRDQPSKISCTRGPARLTAGGLDHHADSRPPATGSRVAGAARRARRRRGMPSYWRDALVYWRRRGARERPRRPVGVSFRAGVPTRRHSLAVDFSRQRVCRRDPRTAGARRSSWRPVGDGGPVERSFTRRSPFGAPRCAETSRSTCRWTGACRRRSHRLRPAGTGGAA